MTNITLGDGTNLSLNTPFLGGVPIETIAMSLAKQCRFNGACAGFYSIARHSAIGSLVMRDVYGDDAAKTFLMHDAHEWIIGDMVTQVAQIIGQSTIDNLKTRIDREIARSFNVDFDMWREQVRLLDQCMLYWEWCRMMPGEREEYGITLPESPFTRPVQLLGRAENNTVHDYGEDAAWFLNLWALYNDK